MICRLVCCLLLGMGSAWAESVRYAVVGDSYSSGEGATPATAWPAVLADHLTGSGLKVELVANPSRTGWTTEDALEKEMPIFLAAKPTFATLQIGVNDWVKGVSAADFRANLRKLLDLMLAALPEPRRLLVVTIPDFSVTPGGRRYSDGGDAAKGIAEFNDILREEAAARSLPVVDVFTLSQQMARDPSLVARDGLHPSAREYALWEQEVFPIAEVLLKGKASR